MLCRRALLAVVPIFLLAASSAPPAAAATLHLNESSFGDFVNQPIGAIAQGSVGTLDIGANTVTGSVFGQSTLSMGDYADDFFLTLPTGLAITSAQITITNFNAGAGAIPTEGGIVDHGSPTTFFDGNNTFTLSSFGTPGDFEVKIFPAGSVDLHFPDAPIFFSGGFDYVLTYNVGVSTPASALPLPSAMSLGAVMLPLSLAALAIQRRRRQTA